MIKKHLVQEVCAHLQIQSVNIKPAKKCYHIHKPETDYNTICANSFILLLPNLQTQNRLQSYLREFLHKVLPSSQTQNRLQSDLCKMLHTVLPSSQT